MNIRLNTPNKFLLKSLFALGILLGGTDAAQAFCSQKAQNFLATKVCNDCQLTDFRDTCLRGANLEGAIIYGGDWRNVDLSDANLRNARFLPSQDDFKKAVDMRSAKLLRADFSGAIFDYSTSSITTLDFSGAIAQGANFSNVVINTDTKGTDTVSADFKEADLIGANLSNLKFIADSSKSSFWWTWMWNVNTTGSNINNFIDDSARQRIKLTQVEVELDAPVHQLVFNAFDYVEYNPDVAKACGYVKPVYEELYPYDLISSLEKDPDPSELKALLCAKDHWLAYGIWERRRASQYFDVGAYLALNPDVSNLYSGNPRLGINHYVLFGLREGRRTTY